MPQANSEKLLVVGLGNPGKEYVDTRHNVGADTVFLLAKRYGVTLRRKKGVKALSAIVQIGGTVVELSVPTTYMNESGQAVGALFRGSRIEDLSSVVVVHDELDFMTGQVKVKVGGGLAGHNGLRSVQSHLHSSDFIRVRIGIGKPQDPNHGAHYVLSRPPPLERKALNQAIGQAADAIECIALDGVEESMRRTNIAREIK